VPCYYRLPISTAADVLGVSYRTLVDLYRSGKLKLPTDECGCPYFAPGNIWYARQLLARRREDR
jgi:hypothetical protein